MATVRESQEIKTLSLSRDHEIVVKLKNDIGILFELSTLVAEQGVNILAVNASVYGEDCVVRLITDDNPKAKALLAENSFAPMEEAVLLVELPHRPSMLTQVTKALAQAGLDIRHAYAAATREQGKCLLVLHCSNDEDAVIRLRSLEHP